MDEKLKQVREIVETVKNMPPPKLEGLNAYQAGKAEGHLEGMATLAAQLDAVVGDGIKKPLIPNCRVLVIQGPYKGMHGRYIGTQETALGPEAEVNLDSMDLPVGINPNYLQAE